MKKTRKQSRWLALALCLCMLASVFPLSGMTYAAETGCNHVHNTDECGYIKAVEGAPCTFAHEHDDACGYTEAKEAVPCAVEAAHTVHETAVCGYVDAVVGVPCSHVHDESCGGLTEDSTACTLIEDCKLPDGHEGACEPSVTLGDPPSNTTIVASGDCGENGDNMQWSLGTDGVLTISGYGTMGSYYYMGDNQPPWIKYSAQITSIIIEAGVAGIGGHAFYFCTNLTSVTFPESLQSIDTSAFYQCTGLTSATFPNNLQTISDAAFYNCTSLDTLTFLGNTPPKIGPNAFYGVSGIGDIHYPAGAGASYTEDWKNNTAKLSGWTLTEQSGPVADEYYPGDVAVVQGIIENSDLDWKKNDPASWPTTGTDSYLVWSSSEPKRITQLFIPSINLSNSLDVTGLSSLKMLNCSFNNLDALILTGLTALTHLNCTRNNLDQLNVSGLSSLQVLECTRNKLDQLNVSGLGSLNSLSCSSNNLIELDVSGLTGLNNLYCDSNPIQSLKLPGGTTLTVNVNPANSGTVMLIHNTNLFYKPTVTLTATPEPGQLFKNWSGDATGSNNTLTFTLGGNRSITANFAVDPTILTVEFDDNKQGGASLDDNQMKRAVETALGGGNKADFTAIRLTGSAAEITGYNWKYLLNLYDSSNDWTNLTVMDLSGMGSLGEIKNEINSHNEIRRLTTVRFPDSLRTIGENAFYQCFSLADVPFPKGLQTIGDVAFYFCTGLQGVSFPEGLQTIGVAAFSRCGLQSVSFPKGLQTIGNEAFSYCDGLTAFVVDPENQHFAGKDGVLYDKGMETLLQYPQAKSGTSFSIPDTVQTIGEQAFHSCTGLQSVSFPEGLQTIGNEAFSYCVGLQSASFPEGLQTIGNGAFSYCAGLTSMTFLGETPPSLGTNAFDSSGEGSAIPTSGTLYHPAKAADAYASGTFGSSELDGWERKALRDLVDVPTKVYVGDTDVTAGGYWKGDGAGGLNSCNASDNWTVSYAPATGVLTLRNAEITTARSDSQHNQYGLRAVGGELTIHLIGENRVDGVSSSDRLSSGVHAKRLILTGPGTLAATGGEATRGNSYGVWAETLIVNGGTLMATGGEATGGKATTGNSYGAYVSDSLAINGGTLMATGGKAQNISCGVCVNVRSATLTVSGGTLAATGGKATTGDSYGVQMKGDRSSLTVSGGTLAATGGEAPAGDSYGVNMQGYTSSLTVSGGTLIGQGGNAGGGTAQAFDQAPDITAANAQVWYGASKDAAESAGSHLANELIVGYHAAKYVRINPLPLSHSLTVQAGTGGQITQGVSGSYAAGTTISIEAKANRNYTFNGWTSTGGGVFANAGNAATTFTMPAGAAVVTANFRYTGGDNPPPHSHSYGGWKHNDTHHWHECSCGDIADKAVHDFGGWVTDKKPTGTDSGSRHRDCKVCNYRQTESLDPTGPDYEYRTLTDKASGVKVSGYFTDSGLLEVKEMLLHLQGDCDVCDDIRQRQKNGELIVLFDVSLKSGKYKGELDVEIPVGEQYNGQTAIMLHCKDKVLESRTVTVSGGGARGTFSSLSPYAVAKVPGSTTITGLPESYTLLVGQTVSWTPAPAGGAWSYDKDLLSMTKDGDTYTFKALKEGKATATYTVDGVLHTITITVNSSTIPQTGDMSSPWPWTLLMLASLLGCAALVLGRKGGYKKRHG